MRIETLSTFPQMFDSVMGTSIMRIAQEKALLEFHAFDLRDWTHDRHRTTDDASYGGGQGLIMKCEPIFEACDELFSRDVSTKPYTVFLSPAGRVFSDAVVDELVCKEFLFFVCGHYEGIDERAYMLADDIISLGDYVLTGGELASMVIIDAVVRKIPGVLGDVLSAEEESFSTGLLEYPHYTRPALYRGMQVPDVLLSGDHAAIARWRREQSLLKTVQFRSDLLKQVSLEKEDYDFLNSLSQSGLKSDETLS